MFFPMPHQKFKILSGLKWHGCESGSTIRVTSIDRAIMRSVALDGRYATSGEIDWSLAGHFNRQFWDHVVCEKHFQ